MYSLGQDVHTTTYVLKFFSESFFLSSWVLGIIPSSVIPPLRIDLHDTTEIGL